jgi:hypothetical protein
VTPSTVRATDAPPRLPWPSRFVTEPGAGPAASIASLQDLTSRAWALARLLAASVLDVPDFEFKLATGEALFTVVEVAASLEERLGELGGRPDRSLPAGLRSQLAAALGVPVGNRPALITWRWCEPLVDSFTEARFDPLLDGPSERVRRRAVHDLRDAFDWYRSAYAVAPADPPTDAQQDAEPVRSRMGARDARFTQFEHTRDYRKSADWESSGDPYRDDLIELLRVNRDEIDALETFSLVLFDLVEPAPITVLRHLARLAWDEARHAAAGHAILTELGYDPYAYDCSMIGIRLRGAMPGWDAWTQITLYGELGIIGPMRALEREARRRGDDRTAEVFAFICRDETLHLKESRELLAAHHPAGDLVAAGAAARRLAGGILDDLGVLSAERYAELDERQIFELLGE